MAFGRESRVSIFIKQIQIRQANKLPKTISDLQLKQARMTQKQWPWVEAGAHAVRKRPGREGVVWAGAGVAWRLCVCHVLFLKLLGLAWRR